MREIGPDAVGELISGDGFLYASLSYRPRLRSFRVAKAALRQLGAVYDHRLGAWRVPVSRDVVGPLVRLHGMSSLALYAVDADETPTRDGFSRYL